MHNKSMVKKNHLIAGLVILAAVAVGFVLMAPQAEGKYDEFAQCLTENGATFYGAFWCPHCKDQKEMFGVSFQHVNYVECSTPDGQSQLPVCVNAGIQAYPTWAFNDGSRQTGALSLQVLAEKTGCNLN